MAVFLKYVVSEFIGRDIWGNDVRGKKTKPPTKPNNKRVKKFKGKQRDHPLLEEGSWSMTEAEKTLYRAGKQYSW